MLGNAASAGILAYPVYAWRGTEGMLEMLAAAGATTFAFVLTALALSGLFLRQQIPSTALMLGRMLLHMLLMMVFFFVLPPVTGLAAVPVVMWMVGFYFVNLAIEVGLLVKSESARAGEARQA
jgi:multisubunit Na+/H+ antiporter MnhG subunit